MVFFFNLTVRMFEVLPCLLSWSSTKSFWIAVRYSSSLLKINLIRHFTVHWQVYLHDLTLSYICTMLPDSNKYGAGSAQKQLGIYTYWPVLFNYHTWLKKINVIKLLFLIFKKFLGRPRFRSVKWIYSACVCLRMLHNEIRNWWKSNKSFEHIWF